MDESDFKRIMDAFGSKHGEDNYVSELDIDQNKEINDEDFSALSDIINGPISDHGSWRECPDDSNDGCFYSHANVLMIRVEDKMINNEPTGDNQPPGSGQVTESISTVGGNQTPGSGGSGMLGGVRFSEIAENCILDRDSGEVKCWFSLTCKERNRGEPYQLWTIKNSLGQALKGVEKLVSGHSQVCALTQQGLVWCWTYGYNGGDLLGNGGTDYSKQAVQVRTADGAVLQNIQQIAAGTRHTCALTKSGQVYCWGKGALGQLGTGQLEELYAAPVRVASDSQEIFGDVKQLAASKFNSCALKNDGSVWCWGWGRFGANGSLEGKSHRHPMQVSLSGLAKQIAAGPSHACALLEGGTVQCWGNPSVGQIGHGTFMDDLTVAPGDVRRVPPAAVVDSEGNALTKVQQISLGNAHGCALLDDNSLKCWGFVGWPLRMDQYPSGSPARGASTKSHAVTVLSANRTLSEGGLLNIERIKLRNMHTCVFSAQESQCFGHRKAKKETRDDRFHIPLELEGCYDMPKL